MDVSKCVKTLETDEDILICTASDEELEALAAAEKAAVTYTTSVWGPCPCKF
jgi:hypothetical protein